MNCKFDLSIIIVNWNASKFLEKCINSIYENIADIKYEIVIVDNNSTDDSCKMIKEKFLKNSNIKLIENKENKGFAGANNQAIKITSSKAVLLLNPDTLINGDVVQKTFSYLIKDESIGVAGCKVLNPDGTLQLACRRMIPTPKDAFFKIFGLSKIFKKNKKMARYNLTYVSDDQFLDVDSVSGSFLMIKRDTIDKIGLLDEEFFMYGEEMDWCLRVKNAGYRVVYCPVGTIIHYKGESSKQVSAKASKQFYKAMFIFYKKNNAKKNIFIVNGVVYIGIFLLEIFAAIKSALFPKSRVGSKG